MSLGQSAAFRTEGNGMNVRMAERLVVDCGMMASFLLLMADRYTGNVVHECLGILLSGLVLGHVRYNTAWWMGLPERMRTHPVRSSINLLTAFFLAGTVVSAVPVSETVFASLDMRGGMSARRLHIFFAHWCFLLAAVHFGLYGTRFSGMVRRCLSMNRRGGKIGMLVRAAVFFPAVYGMYAFCTRELFFPLFMQSSFMLWQDGDHVLRMMFDYLTIFHAAALGGYVAALSAERAERWKKREG